MTVTNAGGLLQLGHPPEGMEAGFVKRMLLLGMLASIGPPSGGDGSA